LDNQQAAPSLSVTLEELQIMQEELQARDNDLSEMQSQKSFMSPANAVLTVPSVASAIALLDCQAASVRVGERWTEIWHTLKLLGLRLKDPRQPRQNVSPWGRRPKTPITAGPAGFGRVARSPRRTRP